MAILCYSRVMVNGTISAMRNMYSASFKLFHSHHDPDLESSNAGSSLAAGELGSRQFGPGSPAAASIARGAAQKSDIQARILAGELPPTGTADLLGALALIKPVGAAEAEPVLAMAVGFGLPGQDGEVIIKLASGTKLRISWEVFKQGRRELFGKDLSDLGSRYEAYMCSTSISQFIMSGGSWADLVFDEAKGHCIVGNAPSETMDFSLQGC